MHDINFIRRNRELAAQKLQDRGLPEQPITELLELDIHLRRIITESESNQAELNRLSRTIGELYKERKSNEAAEVKVRARLHADKVPAFEQERGRLESEISSIMNRLPNFPHYSVPVGTSSTENIEIRRWGTPREFDFPPRPHWEIGERLGILDLDLATKLAGGRFAVYRDEGAQMERAIASFMLDVHTRESGYREVLPPFVANSKSMYGTGNLPKFESELYQLADTDYWLIPTSEVSLTNLLANEIIPSESLPVKLTAWTPCFRREAGSHGRDVRGILRQHQFQKVELVKITRPERSDDELEMLVADAEKILQKLELPYRVVVLCSGDMGFAAAKTFDIEVWLPGQNAFREISSCSNCEAFQARRANIRYRPNGSAKLDFAHTLNGSGLAVGRTWLAILENYQREDGSVVIPKVLRPYMHGLAEIKRNPEITEKRK